MTALSRQFLAIASLVALRDRGAWDFYGGRFPQSDQFKPGFGPITAQSRTVAAHYERGELDGAEEFNRG